MEKKRTDSNTLAVVEPESGSLEESGRSRIGAAVNAFLSAVRKRTGSERTPEEYGRILARFLEGITDLHGVGPDRVHAFAYGPGPERYGRRVDPSPSTVLVRLAAVGGFLDFARRMRLIPANPAEEVDRPKRREPRVKGLEAGDLRVLLDVVPDSPSGLRDRAILLTLALTGLRRSEVLSLRACDLSLNNGAAYYTVRAKGGEIRTRELPAPALEAIKRTLETERRSLSALAPEERIFQVSGRGFAANLSRYAKRAGVGRVTPHVLRHTAAKLRRRVGADIEEVQGFLGHRSLATTAQYLRRLEGVEDARWRDVAALLCIT